GRARRNVGVFLAAQRRAGPCARQPRARARRDVENEAALSSRRSNRRRVGLSELRIQSLERLRGAGQYAEGSDRDDPPRGRRRPEQPRSEEAFSRAGHRAGGQSAGGVRRIDQERGGRLRRAREEAQAERQVDYFLLFASRTKAASSALKRAASS